MTISVRLSHHRRNLALLTGAMFVLMGITGASLAESSHPLSEIRVHVLKRNYAEAEAELKKTLPALTLVRDREEAYWLLAQSQEQQKKNSEALSNYKLFLELTDPKNPERTDALLSIGRLAQELQSLDVSSVAFQEVLSLKLGTDLQIAQALLGLSRNDYQRKRYSRAVGYLEASLSRFSSADELHESKFQSLELEFLLQVTQCSAFPTSTSLKEAQWLDQLERKGTCLLKLSTLVNKLSPWNTKRPKEIAAIRQKLSGLISQYEADALNDRPKLKIKTQSIISHVRELYLLIDQPIGADAPKAIP